MTKNELFESLLNERVYKGICRRCGNHASHALIYCGRCGDKFFRPASKCTMWELFDKLETQYGDFWNLPVFESAEDFFKANEKEN